MAILVEDKTFVELVQHVEVQPDQITECKRLLRDRVAELLRRASYQQVRNTQTRPGVSGIIGAAGGNPAQHKDLSGGTL